MGDIGNTYKILVGKVKGRDCRKTEVLEWTLEK
jgi:hypothetical protein